MKILVIDDTAFTRMSLNKILSKAGYECAEAANASEAYFRYKDFKPDLVFLDILMPDVDGMQILKRIKEFDPSAYIIMCSAEGQQDKVVEAIKYGAKDFIVKPFKFDRIFEAIESYYYNN